MKHKVHPFKVCTSVVWRRVPELCANHHGLIRSIFFTPKRKKLHTHQQSRPSLPPQSPAIPGLLSVSMDLPILNMSHELSHLACSLLYLAFRSYFPDSPSCEVHWCFVPFYGQIIAHCMNIPHFVIPTLAIQLPHFTGGETEAQSHLTWTG